MVLFTEYLFLFCGFSAGRCFKFHRPPPNFANPSAFTVLAGRALVDLSLAHVLLIHVLRTYSSGIITFVVLVQCSYYYLFFFCGYLVCVRSFVVR